MEITNELLEILIKNVDEGIHIICSDYKTIIYNKAMEALEGMEGSEVIGKNILDVFPGLDKNSSTLCKVLSSNEPIFDRYQSYVNKKGYSITAVNTTIPIQKEGKVIAAVEISKDFTRIKELYDRIINLSDKDSNNESNNIKNTFDTIIGCNPIFMKVINMAKKAAETHSTILIYGETGTGKEVFARAIHQASKRSQKPFLAVNCAALPEGLLEGILFGTVKGGFTGAINRPGLFEQADGGTLLLDEINSMGTALQAKLLRVIQEGYVRRIGDIKDTPVDVRIIATTNEDPLTAIEKGTFRKDLYYRLSVVNLTLPPLRVRKEDISLLIKEFINKYNKEFSKEIWDVSTEVYDAFMSYDWRGNIRELKNYIEGAMNMVSGHILKKEHFSPRVQNLLFNDKFDEKKIEKLEYDFDLPVDEYIEDIEKTIILKALEKSENNISEAARILKIKRQTLQHKMKKYSIK